MRIDPWSSQQSTDYARLRDEFGIESFAFQDKLPDPSPLIRRGIIFGHRGFGRVMRAIDRAEPWGVLTGLMPSGPMHLGHKMVMDQVTYYQRLGADVTITVADIEAYATRGLSLDKCRDLAINNYVRNYLALGLKPENCQVYFQSQRAAVKDMVWKLGKRVNLSTMQSIYGIDGEWNLGHIVSPLVQVGDILHTMLPEYGGPRPIVVPVGVDQDPHVRLTRDLADASRLYNVQAHEDPKLGKVTGVFLKSTEPKSSVSSLSGGRDTDDDVEKLLNKAKATLEKAGFGDFKLNVGYKALYLLGATTTEDRIVADEALAKLESKMGHYGFLAPASTYHRFQGGLTGGKMSSSKPETHISLEEDPATAVKKFGAAQTGGRASADEQRKLGGEPEKCMVYETYVYHLIPDDKELADIYAKCKSGTMLCGECKGIGKEKINAFLRTHKDKRDETEHLVKEIVRDS